MRLPVSWLRDFVDVPAEPATVAARLASCGFEVASIDGDVIDLEITANRPDCLSVYGLAREAATAFDRELKTAPPDAPPSPIDRAAGGAPSAVPVTIEDDACGRYALALADVKVGPSPAWLADRLVAAGVRPINNIVDVTNYVMIEMGHPMHAFDTAKLAGPEIRVRLARPEEKLTTLDGETRSLAAAMLVIADRDRPVAVAGVMGGAASEVSPSTRRVALESAWFRPASVRATSRRLGLKTEASARFERGADPAAPPRAIARALAIFEQIGAGCAVSSIVDVCPLVLVPRSVPLARTHLARLLGDEVPVPEVERILTRLGFKVSPEPDGWTVEVPTFRVDVVREADLIEEVGRHWGFDRIPPTFPALRTMPRVSAPAIAAGRTVRRVLTAAGLQEAVTFTFVEEEAARPFVDEQAGLVAIANPLSEKFAVLRPSLLPGLLDALIYNRRRESETVRLFESGTVFGSRGERHAVGWAMTGSRGDHWSGTPGPIDFFDVKGTAELLAAAFGAIIDSEVEDRPYFVRGRSARIIAMTGTGAVHAGAIGQIRPELAVARGLGQSEAVFAGEIELSALVQADTGESRAVVPLPRFPSIVRDLSIVVDERLPAATVRGTIRASAPLTLATMREFDRYQGPGVPTGRVSLSMRLTFRAGDRTLTDVEVQNAVERIVAALAREHGATLRGQ